MPADAKRKAKNELSNHTVAPNRPVAAPDLPYRPRDPQSYRPAIGLIGCGGITQYHLAAYEKAGYAVVALCDIDRKRAEQRRAEFYPDASIYQDYRALIRRDDVEVVDIATHPPIRPTMIEAALLAGKHVLSQKPFVLDLDVGSRLVELADKWGVQLAVNQNARWAPHFSYIRQAIETGLLGELSGVHCSVHWDHSWIAGTEFENVKHLILYDFAVHWFDLVTCFLNGRRAKHVYASTARTSSQTVRPALLGQALIEYDDAQASLAFDGDTKFGSQDRTYVTGSKGAISSVGPGNQEQQLTMYTAHGIARPELDGHWFPDGFQGTMGELLLSIEQQRRPTIDAARNLDSLAICFAAVASSERHEPVTPGSVRQLPGVPRS